MSLDITLYDTKIVKCPHCSEPIEQPTEIVYDCNITHNLSKMADEAKINGATWDAYGKKCRDVTKQLEKGIKRMKDNPEFYECFDSPNGWGTYKDFMPWLERLLEKYKEYPNAEIHISR